MIMTKNYKEKKQRKIANIIVQNNLLSTPLKNQALTISDPINFILQDYYQSLTDQNPSDSLNKLIQDFEEFSISNRFNLGKDTSPIDNYDVLSDIVLISFTNLLQKESSKQLMQKAKSKEDLQAILLIDQLPQQNIANNQDLNTICIDSLRASYSKRTIEESNQNYKEFHSLFLEIAQRKQAVREKYFQLQELISNLLPTITKLTNIKEKIQNPQLEEILQKTQELKLNCNNLFLNTTSEFIEETKTEKIQIKTNLEEQISYLTSELKTIKELKIKSNQQDLNAKIMELQEELEKNQNLNEQFRKLKQENISWANELLYLNKDTVAEVEDLSLPDSILELYNYIKNINLDLITYKGFADVSEAVKQHREFLQITKQTITRKVQKLYNQLRTITDQLSFQINYKKYLEKDRIFKRIDISKVNEYKQKINLLLEKCELLENYSNTPEIKINLENLLTKVNKIRKPLTQRLETISRASYNSLKYSLRIVYKIAYNGSKYIVCPTVKFLYKYPKYALGLGIIGAATYFGNSWYQNNNISFHDLARIYHESNDINSLRKNLPSCIQIKYIDNNGLPDLYKPGYGILLNGKNLIPDCDYLRQIVKNPLTNFPPPIIVSK